MLFRSEERPVTETAPGENGRKAHWENVYSTKAENQVSWFQEAAGTSLELLAHPGISQSSAIIDVGGGASRLVDALLDRGHTNLTVLDLSAASLAATRARLGARSAMVRWIEADITRWQPDSTYDAWHDRAVLHFLTTDSDRAAYLHALRRAVRPGGLVAYATCSPHVAETHSIVDGFLRRHPDFQDVGVRTLLRPDTDGTDGMFAALLRRTTAD